MQQIHSEYCLSHYVSHPLQVSEIWQSSLTQEYIMKLEKES